MATPAVIGPHIVASHPILGCYLLIAAEKSTLISFFGNFGNRGWMDEVELASPESTRDSCAAAGTQLRAAGLCLDHWLQNVWPAQAAVNPTTESRHPVS